MGKAGKLTVLKNVSFNISEGEFVAITGPSGSGKSTMMNLVGALDIPIQGSVYLDGKNIASMGESSLAVLRGEKIGFVRGLRGVIIGSIASGYISLLVSGAGGGISRAFGSTSLSPGLLIFAFGFSIVLGMVAGAIPAYKASRLRPVDALRYE